MSISGSTALTILYLGTKYEPLVSDEERQLITELWQLSAVVDQVISDNAWRAIKSKWLRVGGDQRSAFERMMARLRYADENAIFITRELLRDPTAPPNQKAACTSGTCKNRLAEDDNLIQDYLDESSSIHTSLFKRCCDKITASQHCFVVADSSIR